MSNLKKNDYISSLEYSWFVFLKPNEKFSGAQRFPFCYDANDPTSIEKNLKFYRRSSSCIPEGNVAVLYFNPSNSSYYYYKTIKNRRKCFALPSDSE